MTRGELTSCPEYSELMVKYKGNPKSEPYETVAGCFSLEHLSLEFSALSIVVPIFIGMKGETV